MPPVLRKPLGVLVLIAGIAAYAALVGLASSLLARALILAQGLFYLVAGLAWVPFFMPLMRFIETGRFTKRRGPATPPATIEE